MQVSANVLWVIVGFDFYADLLFIFMCLLTSIEFVGSARFLLLEELIFMCRVAANVLSIQLTKSLDFMCAVAANVWFFIDFYAYLCFFAYTMQVLIAIHVFIQLACPFIVFFPCFALCCLMLCL